MRIECPHCRQSNPQWARFCQFCGKMLVTATETMTPPSSTTITPQFIKSPKKCDNPECHGIIDGNDLKCRFCGSLQLKPHVADVIAARMINLLLGVILYVFFLETMFSQSISTQYFALSIFTIFTADVASNLDATVQHLMLVAISYFLVIIIGQALTKGQNIGFDTVQVRIIRKKSSSSAITTTDELGTFQRKLAFLWAIIETFDMWTFFSLSLVMYTFSMLFTKRKRTSFFISDWFIGGILVDKKKIENIMQAVGNNADAPATA